MKLWTTVANPATAFSDADVLARTRDIIRDETDTTYDDPYLNNCIVRAVTHLEEANGILLQPRQVTVGVDSLRTGDKIVSSYGPVTAVTSFGDETSTEYYSFDQEGFTVLQTQQFERGETKTIVYTAGFTTLTDTMKFAIAECAADIFDSVPPRNSMEYLNRNYVI